jgi:D-3-phosphoglycerate dehydrogenase / 2-oxoglutarate reductase
MKLLAIADNYIPPEFMRSGLAPLHELGVDMEVRHWSHSSLVELQQANLAIEKGGSGAVSLPRELSLDVSGFDIVVAQFAPLSREFIEAASALKVIAVLRGGTENVDVACATARGIAVLNTPARLARAVAECTVGLILAEIRNIARGHARLKQGQWERAFPNAEDIPELYRRTVGLVGYGAVAQLVAGYLRAFGCHLLAYDPFFQGDPAPAVLSDLASLLRESDVVSLHARLSPDTQHLIGARELNLMKPTAVLVNTARSGLVAEAALVQALTDRRIMGAALDVFDIEPLPPGHPFLRLDNVTLTPHLAGSTRDGFRNSPVLMAGHLARLLRGEGPLPVVNGVTPRLAVAKASA